VSQSVVENTDRRRHHSRTLPVPVLYTYLRYVSSWQTLFSSCRCSYFVLSSCKPPRAFVVSVQCHSVCTGVLGGLLVGNGTGRQVPTVPAGGLVFVLTFSPEVNRCDL
jgi:hypothetical protein